MPLGTKKSTYTKVALDEEAADVEAAAWSDDEQDGDVEEPAGAAGGPPAGVVERLRAMLPAAGVGAPSLGPCVNLQDSRHPWVAFFHVFFKVAALGAYLLGTWFTDNFVLIFVASILFLAMDFWTVKNVSGRLLVGLRWWNEIAEDGQNIWKFESIQDPSELRASDSTLFWTAMVGATGVWCTFALSALLSFKISWLLIVLVAVTLQCSNVVGYYHCRKDAGKQMQDMMAQGMATVAASGSGGGSAAAAAGLTSLLGAAASGAAAAANSGGDGRGAGGKGSQSDTI
jgi:hypothetical protein